MINLLASEKSINKSMVTNLCFLFTACASDREVKILISIGLNHTLVKKKQFRVLVNGVTSTTTHISSGIPQGSILGHLLFLVYI